MANAASPVCPLCEGSGWKPVAGVGPGQPRRVTRCDCMADARTQRLLEAARIPARYEPCELSNFEPPRGPYFGPLSDARLEAGRFVEEYPVEKTGLLLVGPMGVGKTHLAVGVLKELIASKGISCLFCDYRELLKEIQNSYNSSVQTTELEVLRPIFDAEVLVLDELGATKPTEWVWDTVSLILNTRYNNKRATIITTNLPDEAESTGFSKEQRAGRQDTLGDRITERMRSRLHEMCRTVQMQGEDFRKTVKSVKSGSFR